ncbi:metallophosphoesterase [bacterium]|nr:metallophosphoesterase [bacterium]
MRPPKYALVLSDLHFGDTRCSLHSMRTAHALMNRLKEYQPLEEIFLLGDILDLQLATWSQAIEGRILNGPAKRAVGFRYFLNFLLDQTGAKLVTYIPGNHDYKIFDYHSIDRHLILPLRNGKKLSGRVSFFRNFTPSFLQGLVHSAQAQFRVIYPHHFLRIPGGRLLLTHGHYFDSSQSFYQEIAKVFTESTNREEIPRLRKTFFRRASAYQNVVSSLSMQPALRNIFNSIYQPVTSWKETLRHRNRKTFLTRAMRRNIESYVTFCCRGKVEGVIFGHTHHPGKMSFQDGPVRHVWNSGSFLKESEGSPAGSFLTVQLNGKSPLEDAVKVHLL